MTEMLRLYFFIGGLVLLSILEAVFPRKERCRKRLLRWPNNMGIVAFNTLVIRYAVPLVPAAISGAARDRGFGLFALFDIPYALEAVCVILILDLVIYWQHVLFHKIGLLWRFHRMHHLDQDLDATSGVKFHLVEIAISVLIKSGAAFLLGTYAELILLFEVVLNLSAMFNHANLRIHKGVDGFLRKLVVTPDFHRVHHSVIRRESDSNYGFFLPWWDYLFRSYTPEPEKGHEGMTLGCSEFLDKKYQWFHWMLISPVLTHGKKKSPEDISTK